MVDVPAGATMLALAVVLAGCGEATPPDGGAISDDARRESVLGALTVR